MQNEGILAFCHEEEDSSSSYGGGTELAVKGELQTMEERERGRPDGDRTRGKEGGPCSSGMAARRQKRPVKAGEGRESGLRRNEWREGGMDGEISAREARSLLSRENIAAPESEDDIGRR